MSLVDATPATRRAGALALVGTTMLWGVSFALVGDAISGRGVGEQLYFLLLRFSLATLAFLPLARGILGAAEGRGLLPWLLGALVGVLLFCSFWLQTMGLSYTTPSRSAFITVMSVPMVPFLAALWRRRRVSRAHALGSLAALAGVGIVLSPEGRLAPNVGDWLTLACAAVFAVAILVLERATRRAPAGVLAVSQIATVALCAGAGVALVGVEPPDEWPGLWTAVVVTGIACTTLALGLMTWGQARVSAEAAAMIFALEPVCAALFELAYTGRALTGWQWAGGAVVVAAVAVCARLPVPGEPPAAPEPAA